MVPVFVRVSLSGGDYINESMRNAKSVAHNLLCCLLLHTCRMPTMVVKVATRRVYECIISTGWFKLLSQSQNCMT